MGAADAAKVLALDEDVDGVRTLCDALPAPAFVACAARSANRPVLPLAEADRQRRVTPRTDSLDGGAGRSHISAGHGGGIVA
jgi:hypothetical protein